MRENQHTEWKETWRDEYLRWICGFANAQGGVLVIGRNDKGVATSLPNATKLLQDIQSVYHDKLMIWNPGQLPQNWTLERLTSKHASAPSNPDIANAFFRVAFMESWGRGIELIRSACHAAGEPEPIFRWDNGLWVEFPFPVTSTDHVEQKLAGGWGEKWGEKWGETLTITRRKIVEAMIRNPQITSVQLVTEVGISSTAIEKNLKFLKENGFIARIGPAKGGHWEVLK